VWIEAINALWAGLFVTLMEVRPTRVGRHGEEGASVRSSTEKHMINAPLNLRPMPFVAPRPVLDHLRPTAVLAPTSTIPTGVTTPEQRSADLIVAGAWSLAHGGPGLTPATWGDVLPTPRWS
jgi:hypothetical protein